jgi:hypothetical protein
VCWVACCFLLELKVCSWLGLQNTFFKRWFFHNWLLRQNCWFDNFFRCHFHLGFSHHFSLGLVYNFSFLLNQSFGFGLYGFWFEIQRLFYELGFGESGQLLCKSALGFRGHFPLCEGLLVFVHAIFVTYNTFKAQYALNYVSLGLYIVNIKVLMILQIALDLVIELLFRQVTVFSLFL